MEPTEASKGLEERLTKLDNMPPDDTCIVNKLNELRCYIMRNFDSVSVDNIFTVIRKMHYFCQSPKRPIKDTSSKLATTCLKSLDTTTVEKYFPLRGIPVISVDTRILLKRYSLAYLRNSMKEIVQHVLRLFTMSVFDQEGGYLYDALLRMLRDDFTTWKNDVFPVFKMQILEMELEGSFYQSLIKYWIPKTLDIFKEEAFKIIMTENCPLKLKLTTAYLARKRGIILSCHSIEQFCGSLENLILEEPELTMSIVSVSSERILRNVNVLKEDFEYFKLYINLSRSQEPEITFVRKFLEKLFASGHLHIDNLTYQEDLFENLNYIHRKAVYFIQTGREVGGLIWQTIWDITTGDLRKLNVEGLPVNSNYKEFNNSFYLYLLHDEQTKWWFTDMSSPECGNQLVALFLNGHLKSVGDLIVKYYKVYIPSCDEIIKTSCTNFMQRLTLKDIEYFSALYKLLVNIYGDSILTTYLKIFYTKLDEVVGKDVLDLVALNTLLAQILPLIPRKYDHVVTHVLTEYFETSLIIVEEKLHHPLHLPGVKVYERFMIDTFCQVGSFKELADLDKIARILVAFIQNCDLKRPTMEAAKALKHVNEKMGNNNKVRDELLRSTIDSLKEPDQAVSNIRKNPQSRLVVQALCRPIDDTEVLTKSIEQLIDIIENNKATDQGLAYTFTCLEVIVNDVDLHTYTLKYIRRLFIICLKKFTTQDYVLRNSILQLYSVLQDRILGARAGNGCYYSLCDAYQLHKPVFKDMIEFCNSDRSKPGLQLVLLFFSHGINRYSWFEDHEFEQDMETFRDIFFITHIVNPCKLIRICASKAFTRCLSFYNIYPTVLIMKPVFSKKREFEIFISNLFDRYEEISCILRNQEKLMILRTIQRYLRHSSENNHWDLILERILQKIDIKFLVNLISSMSSNYNKKQALTSNFGKDSDIISLEDINFLKYYDVLLVNILKSRSKELKTEYAEKIINTLALLVFGDDHTISFMFSCVDFMDHLLVKFKEVKFSSLVIDVVSTKGHNNTPQLLVRTFVQTVTEHLPSEDLRYLFMLIKNIILSRKLMNKRDMLILHALIRSSYEESQFANIFLCIFNNSMLSLSHNMCSEAIFRLFGKHVKNCEEAFAVFLDYEILSNHLSRECFAKFLRKCAKLIEQNLNVIHASRFYVSCDSEIEIVRKTLVECRSLIYKMECENSAHQNAPGKH